MLIKLESRLKSIRANFEDDIPIDEIPVRGTIAIIHGTLDFSTIDGYIRFLNLAMCQIPILIGKQDEEWQKCIDSIWRAAERLNDKSVRFKGHTPEEFKEYCRQVSDIMDRETDIHLLLPRIKIITSDDLVSVLEEHVAEGDQFGFYYEEGSVKEQLMNELMEQLCNLKMEKSGRQTSISYFLQSTGYHEHIHDAMNLLIQTGVYAVNCRSTRCQETDYFDIQKINMQLEYVTAIIQRIEHLT